MKLLWLDCTWEEVKEAAEKGCVAVAPFGSTEQHGPMIPAEGQPGIHASRWETSETLADRPELVVEEKRVRPTLRRQTVPEWTWLTHELSETGAFGDPSQATAEQGNRIWQGWAEAVGLFIKRLYDEPL